MAGDGRGVLHPRSNLRLGPVFRVRALHRRFTVLAGPEANLFVTREGSRHLRSREFWMDFDQELGAARSMVSMDGAEHARMRKAQQPGYSRSFIHEHLDDVDRHHEARGLPSGPSTSPFPACTPCSASSPSSSAPSPRACRPRDYLDDMIVFVRTLLAARVTRQRPAVLTRTPRFRRARQRVEELYATVRAAHDPDRRSGAEPDLVDELMALHHGDPAVPAGDRSDAGGAGAVHRRARHGGEHVRVHALRAAEAPPTCWSG